MSQTREICHGISGDLDGEQLKYVEIMGGNGEAHFDQRYKVHEWRLMIQNDMYIVDV